MALTLELAATQGLAQRAQLAEGRVRIFLVRGDDDAAARLTRCLPARHAAHVLGGALRW